MEEKNYKKTKNTFLTNYNLIGDYMKIYLDYIFFINMMFDFLLLLSVSIILKRNVKITKIIFGSIVGALSTFILFFKIDNLTLFLVKFIISLFMILISFSYKNIKYTIKNLSYLYMSSMILGGALYFFNIQFSYNHEGLIFYHNGLSINLILLIILSPIIIYTYIKQSMNLKNNYSKYYNVNIKYKDKEYKLTGFLDTGNKLIDPITKRPIIIVDRKYFKNVKKYSLVPFTTISGNDFIKCIKVDDLIINNKKISKKFLVGISSINMEGVSCILNTDIMEEI